MRSSKLVVHIKDGSMAPLLVGAISLTPRVIAYRFILY